jgi:hypothetical protein
LGVYHGFPNTGGTIVHSWGPYPTVTAGYPTSEPPTIGSMYMVVQGNGIVGFFPTSAGAYNTAYFQNNIVSFGPNTSQGANTFTTSFANNYVQANTPATTGANVNSPNLTWGANVWTGAASTRKDLGFQHVVTAGPNPQSSLRFIAGNNPGGSAYNIDLSFSTSRNRLGFINLTASTVGAAGTDSILVKNNSGDVGAVSANFYQRSSSAAIGGSISTTVTAVTTFTVTIPTQANANYQVSVQGRNAASVGGWVTNQTTTSFDYILPTAITGTASFHWILKPYDPAL